MLKKRNVMLFSSLGIVSIAIACGIIFWQPQKAFTKDTKEGFVRTLQNEMGTARNRQALIEAYCDVTSDHEGFEDPSAPGLYYDPSQSLFLGLLCTHTDGRDKVEDLVKEYDWEDLRISGCEWNGSMTTCDMSVFLPKVFAVVMNDLSKAKLAQLYSFQGNSTDEAIKAFSDTYFGPGETMCGSKNTIYLGKTQGSAKEAPCMHPQTNTILGQYIQQAGQIANQTTYINAPSLLKPQADNCEKNPQNFLVCGFDNTNRYAWDAFHNTLYNELLFYNIFVELMANRIQEIPSFNKLNVVSNTSQEAMQEITRLKQETLLSQEAIMYTEKTLQNMQATFPMHIALLAYYEDVLAFRKSLLRIYTPIHQLYYKLRNVQQKQ